MRRRIAIITLGCVFLAGCQSAHSTPAPTPKPVTVRVAVVVTVTVTGFAVGAGVLCALWQPAKNTQPNVKIAACLRMNITCFFA